MRGRFYSNRFGLCRTSHWYVIPRLSTRRAMHSDVGMSKIKGPAIFLAQFMGDEAPFNSLPSITAWVKSLGYIGGQLPSWDGRVMDLKKAAESKTYCDDLKGQANGLTITELSSHLQGQLASVHPAYDESLNAFTAREVRRQTKPRT